jgi:hypothetical protein
MTDRHAVFIRTMNGLAPHNEAASESLKGLALGARVKVAISRPRNAGHHDKYFAMLAKVAAAVDVPVSALHLTVKYRAGYVVWIKTAKGDVPDVQSIAWHKMSQAEFAEFYDRAVRIIAEDFLPHLPPSKVARELEEMIAA